MANGRVIQPSGSGTISLWHAHAEPLHYPALEEDIFTEVCVVGAGIAGLTTAYSLLREGRDVTVIEDRQIGAGETGRSTAHITNALDDRYLQLEKIHGEEGAALAAQSHSRAMSYIREIVESEGIECDLRSVDGYLFLGADTEPDLLRREHAAIHRAGLRDVELVSRAPLGGFDTGPALRFPAQAQFNPLRYLHGLAHAITQMGGAIYTRTRALEIVGDQPARITTTDRHLIRASHIVVATNTPVNDLFALHLKQGAYRTYVLGLEVARGSIHPALYWDTADPYHYVRLEHDGRDPDVDVLICGGEDHKTGHEADPFERFIELEQWCRERFPEAGAIRYRWSGQIMEPADGLGFIGRNPMDTPNVYVVTGDSGNGITHGTLAGLIIPDLIAERPNTWAALYAPNRMRARALPELAMENISNTAGYREWMTGSDYSSEEDVPPGAGAVIRNGLSKLAVYRDEEGALHRFSAVCRHLGCPVQWNAVELSWDCPCHGSRYDCYGKVINGPAIADLLSADEPLAPAIDSRGERTTSASNEPPLGGMNNRR